MACSNVKRKQGEDSWIWLPSKKFSIKEAIKAIQVEQSLVSWSPIVWGKHSLPRYAIILWIACWKRMNTLDKLHEWGLTNSNICVLCHVSVENHDHLFFQCSYSILIWHSLLTQLGTGFRGAIWSDIIEFLGSNSCWHSKLQKDLGSFGFASAVYHIWRERNTRIFKKTNKEWNVVLKEILDSVSYSAISWRGYKNTRTNWELALNFGLSLKIFTSCNAQHQNSLTAQHHN